MKHLVIAVSPDSSLELLSVFADVVVLDNNPIQTIDSFYETIYIRSHFGQQSTLPQNFRTEINNLVNQVKGINPKVRFVDDMGDVDAIVGFEDKWRQYETFGAFMPRTELYSSALDTSDYTRPVFKNRLSSRGTGVTWSKEKALGSPGDWIIQESLDIQEEIRIYIIHGKVFPVGAVKRSMTEGNKAESVSARELTDDEIEFSLSIIKQSPNLDIIGLDVARTSSGELKLMEVNRSPGFGKFYELTGVNLAENLYKGLEETRI